MSHISQLCDRLLEAAEHLGEIRQHEVVPPILEAVDAIRCLSQALETLVETCERDKAGGYQSSLRTYVLEIAKPPLAVPA